ncbi:MAG: cytidylate kinase-like family protein [Dehalococcoidia bacterium]
MAIITIARGAFSGGQKLAESVAERLGYRCVSPEVLTEAAKRFDVSEDKLYKSLIEKPGLLKRLTLERVHYAAFIRAALCQEVKDDNIVYHGHAGHLLLTGVAHVIKVRVMAGIELRIRAAMERHGFSREEAIALIDKVDDGRAKWTKFLYHVDWHDPSLYDMTVNLDHMGIPSACELVCATVNLQEFRTTPESQRTMDDLVLSTDVRGRIAAEASIGDKEVEVKANGGVVVVVGTVNSIEEADKVKEIARNSPGTQGVESKLQVRTNW